MTIMLIAQLVIHSSAPPLSPADAVRVLRASHSISDRTGAYVVAPDEGPRVFVIPRVPAKPVLTGMPIYNPPITFRLPYHHRRDR